MYGNFLNISKYLTRSGCGNRTGRTFSCSAKFSCFADILSVQIKDFFDFDNEQVIDTDNEMSYYFKGLDERGRNYFKKVITLYKEEHY